MLRDMKLHNFKNSVAKRLVSDASVRSKYIRGVTQERTRSGAWCLERDTHRKGVSPVHTDLGEAIPLA